MDLKQPFFQNKEGWSVRSRGQSRLIPLEDLTRVCLSDLRDASFRAEIKKAVPMEIGTASYCLLPGFGLVRMA
jgi:hypothetical protein